MNITRITMIIHSFQKCRPLHLISEQVQLPNSACLADDQYPLYTCILSVWFRCVKGWAGVHNWGATQEGNQVICDFTPSSVSSPAFQQNSQLAVITTASSNCNSLDSEANHAQVNTLIYGGFSSRVCWEGMSATLCFCSLLVAGACHVMGAFQSSPYTEASFLQ